MTQLIWTLLVFAVGVMAGHHVMQGPPAAEPPSQQIGPYPQHGVITCNIDGTVEVKNWEFHNVDIGEFSDLLTELCRNKGDRI